MTKARDIASAAPAPSTVSATELGYLDGVTSAIQTQLDAKTAKSTLSTTGDIYYASSANTPARLGIGSTGNVLTVASGIPSWAAPASGATFVGCLAYRSTSLTVSYNTWTSVPFDDEGVDSDSFHSTSTNTDRITIPTGKGGKYLINVQLLWDQKTSGSQQFRVRLNGSSNLMGSIEGNTGYVSTNISQIAQLTAGDYITVEAYSDSSGGNTVVPYMDRTNYFQVLYLGA
jgi:hypothetical protein